MFEFINVPIGYVLRFFNKIVGNHYIFALLIFAVVVEILLIPFAIKQQKNSIKQAKLRPKEMAIRKKYAGRDDQPTKQKMQEELQALYQKEGYNPMGGCLPLLIQLPVLLLLYNVVINPLKYICGMSTDSINQAAAIVKSIRPDATNITGTNTINLMSHIKDIYENVDPNAFNSVAGFKDYVDGFENIGDAFPRLDYFGVNLGHNPSFTAFSGGNLTEAIVLMIIPVLTFVVYFFSMKINRKLSYQPVAADDAQMGCSNKMMDVIMPLFSVYITFITPAAIGIYWIFKSILGVIKQFIMKKAMPIPTFTEEDYKAAEKELNARTDKAKNVTKSGKIVRSLHHIDDEDFEDTREEALRRKAALEEQEAAEAKAKAESTPTLSSLFGGNKLKKDDKKKDSEESDKDTETTDNSENNDNK